MSPQLGSYRQRRGAGALARRARRIARRAALGPVCREPIPLTISPPRGLAVTVDRTAILMRLLLGRHRPARGAR